MDPPIHTILQVLTCYNCICMLLFKISPLQALPSLQDVLKGNRKAKLTVEVHPKIRVALKASNPNTILVRHHQCGHYRPPPHYHNSD